MLHLNGVIDGVKVGLQISSETPWLAGQSSNNVLVALRSKLGDLVDEILIDPSIVSIIKSDALCRFLVSASSSHLLNELIK